MFELYRRLKWVYQKFQLSTWVPFVALVSYTIFGAFLFKSFEMENDQQARERYRNKTTYAMDQVLERMLEVRCHDPALRDSDKEYQVLERMLEVRCHDPALRDSDKEYQRSLPTVRKGELAEEILRLFFFQLKHAKEALVWFLEQLNLTEVINERTEDTPWTWLGSMFYAGQLYTTIGYGYPTTSTTAGRVASIFYILFGIPIFLIILKDIGRLMSRGLRKLYKRLRGSREKIVQSRT
ncbi:unnamed protein product, partial [Strongylus vulgaris]